MHTSIAAEQLNEFGTVTKKHQFRQRGQRSSRATKKPKTDVADMDNESDPDDDDFGSDGLSMGSSEGSDTEIDKVQPLNAEVFFFSGLQSTLILYLYRL
jgi:hypothetical protein